MDARPSDEETIRRSQAVLLLACDTLLQDLRRTARDGDWQTAVLQQLHRTLTRELRAGVF
jgi:hypothetical protein